MGVKFDDIDQFKHGKDEIEKKITLFSNKYGRLIQNLNELKVVMDTLMHRICAMGERYDERMSMIINSSYSLEPSWTISTVSINIRGKSLRKSTTIKLTGKS